MTLLDAPKYDEVRAGRIRSVLWSTLGLFVVLFFGSWFAAGHPVDWPWHWWSHIAGRSAASHFLADVEHNDLQGAYGVWFHDKDWQQHPERYADYPFVRFQKDWSSSSPDNEYGNIQTHRIAAAHVYGNVLLMAILINDRKSGALNLTYDPKTHALGFSPPDMEINPALYEK